jgi:DNA polymerase delta subunit 4
MFRIYPRRPRRSPALSLRSYEYGPCIGVPRLQRWERAQALGLRPPPEVREILITEEAGAQPEFRESVFFGEV